MQFAQDLINTWSEQAQIRNLFPHLQKAHSVHRIVRSLGLMAALLREDEENVILITEDELQRALARSMVTAPWDNGVNYQAPQSPCQSSVTTTICASAGHVLGPLVIMCQSLNLVQTSSGPSRSLPSVKC